MDARRLGTIYNNDINHILNGLAVGGRFGLDPGSGRGAATVLEDYRRVLDELLKGRPGVLAQNVGMPDPVIYRSSVATAWNWHYVEVTRKVWPEAEPSGEPGVMRALLKAGTDPLEITIEEYRRRGVLVVASYRMNAADWYDHTW